MTFLYPNFLWFLSLASVPVVLHLISRIRLKRVNFSSLFFLKDVKRERFSWLRLKEILLLIFRTLLILFLFLALARPQFQGSILPTKRQAHVAIIVDDSYSMAYGNRFRIAQEQARRIINQLSKDSELMILNTSGRSGLNQSVSGTAMVLDEPVIYSGKNLKLALNLIDQLKVSYFSQDLTKSLLQAQTSLENSSFTNKEIFIITDLQRRAFIPVLTNFQVKFPTYIIDVGDRSENCAIISVLLSERFPQPSRPGKIRTKIKNYGNNPVFQKVVLNLNGKTEEKQLKIAAEEEKAVIFETEIGAKGEYFGQVAIEPDSLTTDDQRYFVFSLPDKIRVLLVYTQSADIFYLERALRPESRSADLSEDKSSNNFDIVITDGRGFRQKNLVNFDVVGIINPSDFTGSDWHRLEYYRQKGGKIFITLGSEPKDKTGLERFCDYELTMKLPGFVTIEKPNLNHPIFEVFAGIDLATAKFFQWSKLRPKQVKILASFSDGSPFLMESEDRSIIIASSAFSLDVTDIVLKPSFLPLIQRIFFYLAKGDIKNEYEIGSTIVTEVPTVGLVKVKTPKEEYSVMPEIVGNQRVVKLKNVNQPGIYRIGNKPLAVNVDSAESDLTRVREGNLERVGFKIQKGSVAGATDLTSLFLYLAFLALVLEMVFLLV